MDSDNGQNEALPQAGGSLQDVGRRKRARGPHNELLTKSGLPKDKNDWTVEDWRELHQGIERIKARIARRHSPTDKLTDCRRERASQSE